ncbi:hypothetical protein NIES22_31700 [Calothrix brevissima NIES-22]|nr:hypothetical protein NIES22_31700 [Calothrix brevissima NIES-22]
MKKALWELVKIGPLVVAATFLAANSSLAGETNEKVTGVSQLAQDSDSMGQVTSVSQFSDVQPTDWAFQALQSLVERYGCIAGYPNGTYRGNRALTRYEFAAGLNACLDRVNELIATATADLVTKQDLATLQRLQEEFSAELATLRGRVDSLEARTAELEANQFSTTTKLQGEAIFNVSQAFGDTRADNGAKLDSNTVFSDRVRLTLNSSFTGKDQLQIRLQGRNTISNQTVTGTNMTRLAYDGSENNSVGIDKINYAFNLTDAVRVKVDATGAELNENFYTFNPDFASSGRGALSRYGRFSPIYRQAGDGAGISVNVNPNGPLSFGAAYIAQGTNASNPVDGSGLFGGSNTFFGQIAFKPNKALNIGFSYARTYQSVPSLFQGTGSAFANRPFGNNTRTEANHYGIQATFQPSAKLALSGWAGYTEADSATDNRSADAWYWAASLGVRDLGAKGNVLGLIFGQPPKITGGSGVASESGTSYHLEGLYKVRVSDNIQVTPGLLVIFNPEHNDNNNNIYVGTLRTTFSF